MSFLTHAIKHELSKLANLTIFLQSSELYVWWQKSLIKK
jgi:hypothetical protein